MGDMTPRRPRRQAPAPDAAPARRPGPPPRAILAPAWSCTRLIGFAPHA